MSHHLKPIGAYSIDDLGPFIKLGDFELLLEEDGSLLVRRLNYASHENVVWRGRGWVQEGKKVDRLNKYGRIYELIS